MTLVLTASLLVPIHAHTRAEMTAWEDTWHAAAEVDLSAGLLTELVDMHRRHAWYWDEGYLGPEIGRTGSTFRGMGSDVEQWRSLVEAYFGANTDAALRVMACESGGNEYAKNPSSSASGLFQFLASTWERVTGEDYPGNVFDGESNIAAAAELTGGGSDWSQWNCRP
jgi:hypothetical protein